jgi:hypothetical protein
MDDYWNNNELIAYPDKISEREVEAELFMKLKCLGYNIRYGLRGSVGGRRTKFDMVIFNKDNQPKFLVEVKSSNYCEEYVKNKFEDSKRKQKYDKFNIPTLCCANVKSIPSFVANLLKVFEPDGKSAEISHGFSDTPKNAIAGK